MDFVQCYKKQKKMGSIYINMCLSPASTLLSYCLGLETSNCPFDGTMFPVEHNFEVDVIGRFLVAGKTGP